MLGQHWVDISSCRWYAPCWVNIGWILAVVDGGLHVGLTLGEY